jgi:putative transposase
MTAPRQVLPGTTYFVTRRCFERRFYLRPSRLTNDLLLYILALAADAYGVNLHAFCVMSNHFHLVLTDPHARLPAFMQKVDSLVARALNASFGRWDRFWSDQGYSAVTLSTPQDVTGKTAYALANPVAAGLVRSPRQWPGLWSAPEDIGGSPLLARRPGHFFDPDGYLPTALRLELPTPPGFVSAADFRGRLSLELDRQVSEAVGARGLRFLGRKRVLRQRHDETPRRREPRRSLNPRVACRDKWKRIEALGRLVEFLRAYREAWGARRRGDHAATFPAGTYLLRVLHGVPCEAFG